MLRKEKNKTKTVAEKVSKLLAHPNDSDSSEDSADEATAPRIVDFDDDYELPKAGSTDFRKRNVKLLSDQSVKYKGKIASRKDFEFDDDEQQSEDTSDDEDSEAYEQSDSEAEQNTAAMAAFKNKLKGSGVKLSNGKSAKIVENNATDDDEDESMNGYEQSDSDEATDDNKNAANEDEEDSEDESDGHEQSDDDEEQSEEEETEQTNIISKQNQQAELQKGVCVQNQLHIWERLLELRINTQKLLNKTNKLPTPDILQTQRQQNEELNTALTTTEQSTGKLLKQLLELQGTLAHQFSELRNTLKASKKRPAPFDGDVPDNKRLATHLQLNFQEFRTYRNSVLLRWDDRTKLLTPGAGAKKNKLQEDYDILKKIDNTLANRSVLVAKSQTLKSELNMLQKAVQEDPAADDAVNSEAWSSNRKVHIYDDSDFYHQQLRELIEYKANTSTNMSEITKQYVELQKLRQKMKKKVDTRASKGRKLRYVVHNKLVNFMAPNEHSDWSEESKNELFKSLFV